MEKLTILFFTINILVVVAGGVPRDACAPADCPTPGEFVASLCDCSEYYICLSTGIPSSGHLTCPSEAPYFNPAIPAGCGNDPSVCPTTAPGSCPVMCTASGTPEGIVDPTDCTKYYICDGTSLDPIGPVTCQSETPWFNGEKCVGDEAGCCAGSSALCEPYCTGGDFPHQIIDPDDCTKFYICMMEGPANELYHPSCPSGQYFDMTNKICSADVSCTTLCVPSAIISTATTPGSGGNTTPSGCLASMQCTAQGYFSMCSDCSPGYFYCESSSGQAVIQTCSEDLLFNPVPNYPYCILPVNCPYDPSRT
ncbi:hypothetical protein Pmani_005408 [Petrolisthes manimaculis]|uniref:Chitin-binding type-2 domain-containing protein n=1 Tax=Petrolisthes manimaculis TaxID=1843537 RepID=A0AAE1QBT4_9EUCA|nr:hypothetical protein Pmani_005408 [Petrolisthes manimaculis]